MSSRAEGAALADAFRDVYDRVERLQPDEQARVLDAVRALLGHHVDPSEEDDYQDDE